MEKDYIYIKEKIGKQVINYKEFKFQQFLVLKTAQKSIIHKKIVQKIFLKYTQFIFNLQLTKQNLGEDPQEMLIISQITHILPKLSGLNLDLSFNKFGSQPKNFQHLSILLQTNTHLQTLNLNLNNNFIHPSSMKNNNQQEFQESLIYFSKGLEKLKNLRHLELQFSGNYQTDLSYLTKPIKNFPNLLTLNLNITAANLSENTETFLHLSQSLKQLQKLKLLFLQADCTLLGKTPQNMENLMQGLQDLPQLKELDLNLPICGLGDNNLNIEYLSKILANLPSLDQLQLNISNNQLNESQITILSEGIKSLNPVKNFALMIPQYYTRESKESLSCIAEALEVVSLKSMCNIYLNRYKLIKFNSKTIKQCL